MIEPLARYIVDNVDGLTLGTTFLVGWRPQNAPDLCTVLLERGPELADAEIPDLRTKSIQLLTRGLSYFDARDEATRIYEFLVGVVGVEITGWYIHSIVTGNAPIFLQQDERGRFEFTTNLQARARKES